MLRVALLVFAAVLTLAGLVVRYAGSEAGTPMAIWGVVLLAALGFERWRYRPAAQREPGPWISTDERFIDPESGRLTTVLYNPQTGERRYTAVGDGPDTDRR